MLILLKILRNIFLASLFVMGSIIYTRLGVFKQYYSLHFIKLSNVSEIGIDPNQKPNYIIPHDIKIPPLNAGQYRLLYDLSRIFFKYFLIFCSGELAIILLVKLIANRGSYFPRRFSLKGRDS